MAGQARRRIERDVLAKIRDWRGMLQRQPSRGRSVLETILAGRRLIFAPRKSFYEIRGVGSLDQVITAALATTTVVTPAGFEPAISTLKG